MLCLNEETAGSARHVFRPWHDRLSTAGPFLRSVEDDAELLMHVPFTGAIKLKGITIIGGGEGMSPSKLKVPCQRQQVTYLLPWVLATLDSVPIAKCIMVARGATM